VQEIPVVRGHLTKLFHQVEREVVGPLIDVHAIGGIEGGAGRNDLGEPCRLRSHAGRCTAVAQLETLQPVRRREDIRAAEHQAHDVLHRAGVLRIVKRVSQFREREERQAAERSFQVGRELAGDVLSAETPVFVVHGCDDVHRQVPFERRRPRRPVEGGVAGFAKGDIQMIGTGMEDEIAEPYRERLIPGFSRVKRAALEAGAAGVSISGAGPSVIAIVDRKNHDPRLIGRVMLRGFAESNVRSTVFVAHPARGATIIEAS